MVTWSHGHMVTWSHGHMVTWSHGHMVTWSYLTLTPATAGVGRCHKIFGRCRQVSGSSVEAHGTTQHTHTPVRQVSLAGLAGAGRCHKKGQQVLAPSNGTLDSLSSSSSSSLTRPTGMRAGPFINGQNGGIHPFFDPWQKAVCEKQPARCNGWEGGGTTVRPYVVRQHLWACEFPAMPVDEPAPRSRTPMAQKLDPTLVYCGG